MRRKKVAVLTFPRIAVRFDTCEWMNSFSDFILSPAPRF
ncbi:hypothetical protein THTE_2565 [Thermogutta terrifontis]|uniref:Uncharacterized protein n=1 Tax=Thermogutta terrifontis TaxID=1331910 RepID=A0A286RGT9_9BACT|nr:hypothetical protein THTE_2565 [Thermogutta terrifontis]